MTNFSIDTKVQMYHLYYDISWKTTWSHTYSKGKGQRSRWYLSLCVLCPMMGMTCNGTQFYRLNKGKVICLHNLQFIFCHYSIIIYLLFFKMN